jgi:hypothetical protein
MVLSMGMVARVLCVGLFVVSLALSPQAIAQELRWKFQPGQRLRYEIVQEMAITGTVGAAADLQNTSRQQTEITWEVDRVDASGDAVIRQRFDRIRTKMTLPTGSLEYDSSQKGPATGMAAVNSPLYAALVKSPIEITVSPIGEVKSVTLTAEVQAALKRMPTAATLGDLSKPRVFQNLFLAGFPTLHGQREHEAIVEWTTETDVTLPTGGKQTIVNVYQNEGKRSARGATLAVIRPKRTVTISDDDTTKRTVKNETSSGEILFDITAGRLQSSTLKHSMSVGLQVAGRPAEQKVEQSIDVKLLLPAAE